MIEKYTVIEKIFKKDRWFVVLDKSLNGKRTIPNAVYVWLRENPAFHQIPSVYVIHHLDRDETNDDISNLALMQRFHHMAYHSKQKSVKSKVMIDTSPRYRNTFLPIAKPTTTKRKDGAIYVTVKEKVDGKIKRLFLYRYNGEKFRSLKDAEKAANLIWKESEGPGNIDQNN